MRESDIEDYLKKCVAECGGETRKVKWIGRANAPDRLILLPGSAVFAELKRPGEKATGPQRREHEKLRWAGLRVEEIATFNAVERLVLQH